jgi:threonine synthase
MREFYERHNILIEPHGAVGIKGLMEYRKATKNQTLAVTLETADPAKFPAEVKAVIGIEPEPPQHLKEIEARPEHMEHLTTDYEQFKEYLKRKMG